jgi:hypothetical protein
LNEFAIFTIPINTGLMIVGRRNVIGIHLFNLRVWKIEKSLEQQFVFFGFLDDIIDLRKSQRWC